MSGKAMALRETLEDVEIGFRQLEFAIKLLSFCELEKIDPAAFDTEHLVQLAGGSLKFPSGPFSTRNDLNRAASIAVLLAFSGSILVLDQAFDAAGMKPKPDATDNIGQLRALIYMVRCAHAHRIADPHWEVRGKYARTLTVHIDGVTISLDLRPLHGEAFDIDRHLGGYVTWYRIRNAVVQTLSTACAA
jgi:hypothetical protein